MRQLESWGFPFEVTNLAPRRFRGTSRGVSVDSGARTVEDAARWALDGLREWARQGLPDPGVTPGIGGSNYFGRITRAWAKWGDGQDDVPTCLGSTLDWLFFFSKEASANPSESMYPVYGDIDVTDLFNLYCWAFANKWTAVDPVRSSSQVNKPSSRDLHRAFWDSVCDDPAACDQTHHFAGFFWLGGKLSRNEIVVMTALQKTGDVQYVTGAITNLGDVLLGLLGAQWGAVMRREPGYMGRRVADSLRTNCGWPWPRSATVEAQCRRRA